MRSQIRDELSKIQPFDLVESAHKTDALAWVDSGVELCRIAKPATPPKHLVAYFAVTDGEHILLVDHKSAELWLPPGGHVEPNEHPRNTVLRELREELGFDAPHAIEAPLMITCTTTVGLTAGHTDVSLWYVVHVNRDQVLSYDDSEFTAASWFSFEDALLQRTDPHLGRFISKLLTYFPPGG
ncbi:MAG: NUDIX hydrolase [Rhodanobacter sp.]